MYEYYVFLVVVLFILAISDLMVGVSNDAVNFLNSAIGSRVAPRHIIMIVASLGIVVGAMFSSGMMEVARKGIIVPENFLFAEIMVIFLAVMITDVILLDLFNTFGLPTSTTVSIVFELLGASVAIALLKLSHSGVDGQTLADFIHWDKAIEIILGILLSVAIAFSVGLALQYLSRLLLSFNYNERLKSVGIFWAGAAMTALSYFLVIKGLKNVTFLGDGAVDWVMDNSTMLLGISFVVWTVAAAVLIRVFKVQILRPIVLFGTFALAMAFAGNDLVNFIGVPIAALQSFEIWNGSGLSPDQMSMEGLASAVRTPAILLIISGLVMVGTLWFSRKARSVTETEVNLGRQDEGAERFAPNALARILVRSSVGLGRVLRGMVPFGAMSKIEANFRAPDVRDGDDTAFDLVRASVNLTVASILISIATSMKLPLSTTYVSFMVAMGASLADRAWGRDSAIFRVAGVLSVISGWFMTALIAFTAAALFATIIFYLEFWGVLLLLALLLVLVTRSMLFHRMQEKEKDEQAKLLKNVVSEPAAVRRASIDGAAQLLTALRTILRSTIDGLNAENGAALADAKKGVARIKRNVESRQAGLHRLVRNIREDDTSTSRFFILVHDLERDLADTSMLLVQHCHQHVANLHMPLDDGKQASLTELLESVDQHLEAVVAILRDAAAQEREYALVMQRKTALIGSIEASLSGLAESIRAGELSARNSNLYSLILLQFKDVAALAARFVKVYYRAEFNSTELLLVASASAVGPAPQPDKRLESLEASN